MGTVKETIKMIFLPYLAVFLLSCGSALAEEALVIVGGLYPDGYQDNEVEVWSHSADCGLSIDKTPDSFIEGLVLDSMKRIFMFVEVTVSGPVTNKILVMSIALWMMNGEGTSFKIQHFYRKSIWNSIAIKHGYHRIQTSC